MRSLKQLRDAVARGEPFDYLLFYGHQARADGTVGSECLSQWYPAAFTVDGLRFATAEHFMMVGKARLFGDQAMVGRIASAPGPSEAKKLGRQVSGFDDDRWKRARFDIVVEGNVAKFGQNDALKSVPPGDLRPSAGRSEPAGSHLGYRDGSQQSGCSRSHAMERIESARLRADGSARAPRLDLTSKTVRRFTEVHTETSEGAEILYNQ